MDTYGQLWKPLTERLHQVEEFAAACGEGLFKQRQLIPNSGEPLYPRVLPLRPQGCCPHLLPFRVWCFELGQ
jgi:hypothetical protein